MISPKLSQQPGFQALFIAQFGGAFIDNLYRSALLIWIAFHLTTTPEQASLLSNLAAALFITPIILLSPIAGQLADRLEKSQMIRKNKLFELAICIFAIICLASEWAVGLFIALALLGAQSAMFGPNKYAILPQLLPARLLVAGNALNTGGTFVAIAVGAIAGSVLVTLPNAWLSVGGVMLAVSLIGNAAARRIPPIERGDPELRFDSNIFRQATKGLQLAHADKDVWRAIGGLSWFWFLGSTYLTQLPAYTRFALGGEPILVTWLITTFLVGLGAGSAVSAKIGSRSPEVGLIAPALAGLAVSTFMFALLPLVTHPPDLAANVLLSARGLTTTASVFLIGGFGGLYIVPQYALLLQRSKLRHRARIVAANNLMNACYMAAAAVAGILLLGHFGIGLSSFFCLAASASLVFCYFNARYYGPEIWRLVAYVTNRAAYRVSVEGYENLPEQGPALLICNHLSYADSILLFGTFTRRTHFIVDNKYYRMPLLKPFLRSAQTIPISSPVGNRKLYESSLDRACAGLDKGDLLFIFPEGRLSPEGDTIRFKRGVEQILMRRPVAVVPVAIDELWGSWFSHGLSSPALSGWPSWRRRSVTIRIGKPLQPEGLTAAHMQIAVEALLDYRADKPGTESTEGQP